MFSICVHVSVSLSCSGEEQFSCGCDRGEGGFSQLSQLHQIHGSSSEAAGIADGVCVCEQHVQCSGAAHPRVCHASSSQQHFCARFVPQPLSDSTVRDMLIVKKDPSEGSQHQEHVGWFIFNGTLDHVGRICVL